MVINNYGGIKCLELLIYNIDIYMYMQIEDITPASLFPIIIL